MDCTGRPVVTYRQHTAQRTAVENDMLPSERFYIREIGQVIKNEKKTHNKTHYHLR